MPNKYFLIALFSLYYFCLIWFCLKKENFITLFTIGVMITTAANYTIAKNVCNESDLDHRFDNLYE